MVGGPFKLECSVWIVLMRCRSLFAWRHTGSCHGSERLAFRHVFRHVGFVEDIEAIARELGEHLVLLKNSAVAVI